MTELQELRRYRRDLHRIPEPDFDLPQTIAYIEGVLAPLACEVTHPCPSCVCAFFDAGVGATHATAIRADMDALPIAEATGVAFASTHPGKMHACGHDGHMAMALAAATFVDRAIREQPGTIKRNVLFVFQPAEETTGWRQDGVPRAACSSAMGQIASLASTYGPICPPVRWRAVPVRCWRAQARRTFISMARVSISPRTYGVPVEESHDAALAAAKFLVSERELMDVLGADEPCIGKFGLLQAGTVCNAVAGEAHVAGSLRVFTDDMFDRAREGVRRVLDEACAATGCTYDLDFAEGYPPVDNDPELFAHIAPALSELQVVDEPLLIAEDFAFYQRYLPGVFFLLGTARLPAKIIRAIPDGCSRLCHELLCIPIPCSLTRKFCSKASMFTSDCFCLVNRRGFILSKIRTNVRYNRDVCL